MWKNVAADVKELSLFSLGVIGFATAVAAIFVEVFHFDKGAMVLMVLFLAALAIAFGFIVSRSEARTKAQITEVKNESIKTREKFEADVKHLLKFAYENQKSCIRTEMDNEMHRNPENHDTIIRYAFRYFKELDGDWVQTEKFEAWREAEEKAGRPVHLPRELMLNIQKKYDSEMENK